MAKIPCSDLENATEIESSKEKICSGNPGKAKYTVNLEERRFVETICK